MDTQKTQEANLTSEQVAYKTKVDVSVVLISPRDMCTADGEVLEAKVKTDHAAKYDPVIQNREHQGHWQVGTDASLQEAHWEVGTKKSGLSQQVGLQAWVSCSEVEFLEAALE